MRHNGGNQGVEGKIVGWVMGKEKSETPRASIFR